MNKRSALAGVLSAAAAVIGAVFVAPAAAQAAYTCRDGEVCLYQHYDKTGSVAVLLRNNSAGEFEDFRNYRYTNGENLNDSVSSVVNKSNRGFWIYSEGSYNTKKNGLAYWIWPGREMNFGPHWSTIDMNDKASSLRTA
ncbi:hypothetical protein FB565_006355 [Actinoplanes lutulentus]|uniref:Peptidase inhibitor family I36 n=1 Tax=Actinoplanes lutulentus TaxID=1287878 RepID=A0A327YXT0_9ACTN|nr:peptidase inhibitor family I36 protein [Actinoplanes lutulentus]MBB2946587.1 hypothetical protein [Actinoplanes lutulentus]RAK26505.1 peptidase inhibitor family I36 [Actinoplanes lutulentus]